MQWDIHGDRYPISIPRVPPARVYLRYGLFAGMRKSSNHATGSSERGLSVYRARLEANVVVLAEDTCPSLDGQGRLAMPVTGREVGVGSDGEPVLVGVRMLPYAVALTAKRL